MCKERTNVGRDLDKLRTGPVLVGRLLDGQAQIWKRGTIVSSEGLSRRSRTSERRTSSVSPSRRNCNDVEQLPRRELALAFEH